MCAVALDQQSLDILRWAVSLVVPTVAGLVGVLIGAWLTSRREIRQRQLAYLEKQLSSFYSPMLGLRNEVRTHGVLRVRVQNEAGVAWQQLCDETQHLDVLERQRITQERSPEFTRLIEYDNSKLHEELLPAYRKMVTVFRENYWLPEPETRSFYPELVEYVEVWNRWVDKALPVEVLKRLDHGEAKLGPFYEHIERLHDAIRNKLKAGVP
jgi:hypothetical protein